MAKMKLRAKKQNIALTGKQGYVIRPVKYSTIDTEELISHASQDSGVNRAMITAAFEALVQQIKELMLNGHNVKVGNLGTFQFGISAKAVSTTEQVSADQIRYRRIRFSPSKELKAAMKAVKFDTYIEEEQ